jgi:hypothetical protein
MGIRLLLFRVVLLGWLSSLAAVAQAQSTPPFDLVQTVGQQLSSPVGGPAVTSMTTDNWGNVYVAGYFTGTVQLGTTTLTVNGNVPAWTTRSFLAKLDATGTYQWAIDFDGYVQQHETRLLAVDAAGNAYLAGTYTGSSATFGPFQLTCTAGASGLYILKVAPDGTYLWARQAADSNMSAHGLAVDRAGSVYLAGGFSTASTTFGNITLQNTQSGHTIACVAKLAANGTWQWAKQTVAGSYASQGDYAQSIAVDSQGNTYVAGSFGASTITLGSITLPNNTPYGFTCDAFIAKLDTAGQWVWGHRLGSPGYDGIQDIAIDANDDVVLLGYMHGPLDINSWVQPPSSSGYFELFVARLTSAGAARWAASAGGQDAEVPTQLALDAAGNAYVTGRFTSATAYFGTATVTNPHSQIGDEAFVAKINPTGTWQWAQQTLATYHTEGHGLGVDPSGTVWLFGSGQSPSTAFSNLTLSTPSRFVARLGSAIYPTLVGGVVPASGQAGQQVTVTGARFTGVTGVFFNSIPATSFTVLSSTKLQAVVPSGATTGGVEVRTAAGGNGPAPVFQVVTALATTAAQAAAGQLWPVPLAAERVLHLRLPYALALGQTGQASLRSVLGAQVRTFALTATESELSLLGLPVGVYVLTVQALGQLPLTQRLVLE